MVDTYQEKLDGKVNSKTRITNKAPLSLTAQHNTHTHTHTSAERSIKDRHSTAHPERARIVGNKADGQRNATRHKCEIAGRSRHRRPHGRTRHPPPPRVDREPKPTDLASTHARTARPRGICARTARPRVYDPRGARVELGSRLASPEATVRRGGLEEHSRRGAGDGREGGSRRGRGGRGEGGGSANRIMLLSCEEPRSQAQCTSPPRHLLWHRLLAPAAPIEGPAMPRASAGKTARRPLRERAGAGPAGAGHVASPMHRRCWHLSCRGQ